MGSASSSRAGGHCLEGFVSDPACARDHRCLADEARLLRRGDACGRRRGRRNRWRDVPRAVRFSGAVVVPLGEYPGIGMGGHVAGGAFGFLCRQLGLAADYLYAVEVVTVDRDGPREQRGRHPRERRSAIAISGGRTPAAGAATSASSRATGFARPNASGDDPATLLPRAPDSITTFKTEWSWSEIDRAGVPATAAESRNVVRAEQRCRLAERFALLAARDPSQAVRQDHRARASARLARQPSGRSRSISRR